MYIVQLAVEGLRGFAERTLFGFHGQLDILHLRAAAQRKALVDTLFCTLYPDAGSTDVYGHVRAPGTSPSRSMLTCSGPDQRRYQLLRDFQTGQARLFAAPEGHKPEAISSDIPEVRTFLRVQLQVPEDQDYEALFVYTSDTRASLGSAMHRRTGGLPMPVVPSGPGLSGFADSGPISLDLGGLSGDLGGFVEPAAPGGLAGRHALDRPEAPAGVSSQGVVDATMPDEVLLATHRSIQLERRRARQLARARRTLAALDEKAQEARAMHTEMVRLERQLEAAEARIEEQSALSSLPVGFQERWSRHLTVVEEYQAAKGELEQAIARARGAMARAYPQRAWHRPVVFTGLGLVGLVWGLLWLLRAPWLAMVQFFLGLGVGALIWWDLHQKERRAWRYSEVAEQEDRLARLDRQYRLDTAAVRGLVDRLGLQDTSDLQDSLESHQALVAERDQARALLEGQIGHHGRRAQVVLRRIAERRAECEQVLDLEASSASMDSIERRLRPVEQEMFRRRLRPLDEEDDPDDLPVIAGTSDIPSLVRPASVLGGSLPHYDDYDDDDDDDESSDVGLGGDGGTHLASGGHLTQWQCAPGEPQGSSGHAVRTSVYSAGGGADAERPAALVHRAAELVGCGWESLVDEAMLARLGKYLSAMTDGDIERAQFTMNDGVVVFGREGSTEYAALEGERLDQVDMSLRFSLLERVLAVRSAPIVVEHPLDGWHSPAAMSQLLGMYAEFSKLTQVIVLSAQDVPAGRQVRVTMPSSD